METVKTKKEVLDNIHTFYRASKENENANWFAEKIKRGINFVYIRENGRDYFCPSRFVGYQNNSIAIHGKKGRIDGGETNLALEKIANGEGLLRLDESAKPKKGKQTSNSKQLEEAFHRLCNRHGVTPENRRRGYWNWSQGS